MRRLEDMMDHYSWNDGDRVIPKAPIQEDEKQRILEKTLQKAGLAESAAAGADRAGRPGAGKHARPSRVGSRRQWTIAAACVIVLVMATVSFAAIALDKNFFDFFHAESQDEIAMLDSLASSIDQQVTDNGLTLDVREAVGDSNSVSILFDVIAPEGTILDRDYYYFGSAFVDLPNNIGGAGYSFAQIDDGSPADNKITMMLSYQSEKNLSGSTMRFRFSDLMTPKSPEEQAAADEKKPEDGLREEAGGDSAASPGDAVFLTGEPGTAGDDYDLKFNSLVAAGNWEIEFPLDYKDASSVVKPEVKLELFGGMCKVKEIRYSPISVTLTANGASIAEADSTPPDDDYYAATGQDMQVKLKDGSDMPISETSITTRGRSYTVTCRFGKIINPADIESISYAGLVIPIQR